MMLLNALQEHQAPFQEHQRKWQFPAVSCEGHHKSLTTDFDALTTLNRSRASTRGVHRARARHQATAAAGYVIHTSKTAERATPSFMAGKPFRHTDQHRYVCCCRLFAMNKRWPVSRVQLPYKTKGLDGRPDRPPPPPAGMTDRQIEMARELLSRAGFTLVRSTAHGGAWWPVRLI